MTVMYMIAKTPVLAEAFEEAAENLTLLLTTRYSKAGYKGCSVINQSAAFWGYLAIKGESRGKKGVIITRSTIQGP
jgi:hypothetical protein